MTVYTLEDGSPVMKSNQISSQTLAGIGRGVIEDQRATGLGVVHGMLTNHTILDKTLNVFVHIFLKKITVH
jgi:hypothetical protein